MNVNRLETIVVDRFKEIKNNEQLYSRMNCRYKFLTEYYQQGEEKKATPKKDGEKKYDCSSY